MTVCRKYTAFHGMRKPQADNILFDDAIRPLAQKPACPGPIARATEIVAIPVQCFDPLTDDREAVLTRLGLASAC